MRLRNSGRWLMMALTVASVTMPLTADAAEKPKACLRDPIVTKLDKAAVKNITDWLKDRESSNSTPVPYGFKVPALATTQIICKLNPEGLRCFESLASLRCPEAVEVQTPGGTTVVPVNCTGPDSEGNCDCDFAQN